MKSVLMVAEKPSLAQSVAQILSNGQMRTRRGGNGACSVHEYTGTFRSSETVKFKMTSVCGHVMSIDFPGKYNNWDRVDPAELFKAPTEKKEASEKLKMPWFLSAEVNDAHELYFQLANSLKRN
ncbi:TOP3B (predicted) [Pycnogonum litorale]